MTAPLRVVRDAPAPASPFAELTGREARQLLDEEVPDYLETTRAFVEGDHWQKGAGWAGPMVPLGHADYATMLGLIELAFVSRNATKEIVERHRDGVIGREPTWAFVPSRPMEEDEEPSDAEQALIDEVHAALTVWWDQRKAYSLLQDAVAALLWAERSALRLYVPRGLLSSAPDETGVAGSARVITAATFEDALELIYPEHPEPEDATVYVDPDTQREVGIVAWEQREGFVATTGKETIELSYAEGDTTVIRTTEQTAGTEGGSGPSYRLPFGGRIPVCEMQHPRFVTEQMVQQQRALNLAVSMLPRNVVTGGFLERIILNAQMPGDWETNAQGEKTGRFIPKPYYSGAGSTNFLSGVEVQQPDGSTTMTTPSVAFRPPVEVRPAIDAFDAAYGLMLSEGKQTHILIQGEATLSGVSREQARADHVKYLGITKSRVEEAGRWLLETVVAMAEAFIGKPGLYLSQLRATFACRIDAGPLTVAEQQVVETHVEKGLLSRESGMERIGVLDSAAESARIAAQPGAMLSMAKAQAEVLQLLTSLVDVVTAAKLARMSDEDIKLIQRGGVEPEPEPEPFEEEEE